MAKGRRVLDRLTQAIKGTPRRFDGGLIEKLEERLCVTSRNCCLNHCPDPFIGNLDKREAFVRIARKSARQVSIGRWGLSIQMGRQRGLRMVE